MQLAVVILNWNRTDDTIRCARSVAGWSRLQPSIWLVDNASRDGERLIGSIPGATILANTANLGFAGGNNVALRRILEQGSADALLLLNNDAEIGEADVQALLASLAQEPDLAVVGPRLQEVDAHGHAIVYAGGRDISRHLRTRRRANPAHRAGLLQTAYVPGAAVLIRTSALHKVGLFDEDFFFSGELADFCERARQLGLQCAVRLDATATHRLDAAAAQRDRLHAYYALRNRFLFVRKHRPAWRLLYWSLLGSILAGRTFLQGRRGLAQSLTQALKDGRSGQFGSAAGRLG